MNFLEVGVKLKSENIQSFINDFLKVDGLVVSDVELKEDLILINRIKYKFFIPLSLALEISRIENGILSVVIKKVKAINVLVNSALVNFILKMVFSKLTMSWLVFDGKQIKIDLEEIFKEYNLNFLALDIKEIKITEENIFIMIDNVDLDMGKLLGKFDGKDEKVNEVKDMRSEEDNLKIEIEPRVQSSVKEGVEGFDKSDRTYFSEYSRVRRNIYNNKFKKVDRELIGKIIFLLPDIGVLCYRLLRDKRIKKSLKILVTFTLVYLINPANFNKKFSILSKIDDVILLVFTLNKIFTSIDKNVLEYHFDGGSDTLEFLIESFDVLNQFVGGGNINKLYTVFEKFTK